MHPNTNVQRILSRYSVWRLFMSGAVNMADLISLISLLFPLYSTRQVSLFLHFISRSSLSSASPLSYQHFEGYPLDWLYDSPSSPPVAGVWWAHWRRCPVAAVASSKWMLHTGGGWGVTPHMIVKRFGCMAIHNKALYKCIIHSFIHSYPVYFL